MASEQIPIILTQKPTGTIFAKVRVGTR